MFEDEVLKATNQMEEIWMGAGRMFERTTDGGRHDIGRILESGPQVERARRILRRLAPPYVNAAGLRIL